MLKAKRKRLREEQEAMDGRVDPILRTHPSSRTLTLSEVMNCSSQFPHPAKRACVDVASASVRVLKEEDPVPANSWSSAEVSKLDPPAVKRPPARCVASAAAELMSNATGGFDQEHQNDKEEEIARRDDREKGDGITEDANDGLQHGDEVNGKEKNNSHLAAPRQKRKSNANNAFDKHIRELKAFKEKHGHVRVTAKQDKSLAYFCASMRCARRGKGSMTITDDRIKALDEMGFAWGKNTVVEDHIEELKTFKAKHGHVRVPVKQDKSLAKFCHNMRSARRGKGNRTVITEDRIKALDELGFNWAPRT